MKIKSKFLPIITTIALATCAASAADVSELWTKNCASCHGKDGTGNTVMGKKSGVENYQDAAVQAKFTDAQAVDIITNGKEKMKSFKAKLTAEEIKSLVAYVRAFKK